MSKRRWYKDKSILPQPRAHATLVMFIRAQGTATLAFLASSLRCVDESNAPTAQRGARKLSKNANPFGQPDTVQTVSLDLFQ